MNASIAACLCSWLSAADAEAEGTTEPVVAVPKMTGTTAVMTADGTPLDVKAATTEEDSFAGSSRLGVGDEIVVASTSDLDFEAEGRSGVDSTAEMLEASPAEWNGDGDDFARDFDAVAVLSTVVSSFEDIVTDVEDLSEINVPGYVGTSRDV